MFGLPPSVRIYVLCEPVDMRKGVNGLCELVRGEFRRDVFSGHLFVFLSRRRERVKILWWDRGGFVLYYKRLERGRFFPLRRAASGQLTLTPAELNSLLEGLDLRGVRRRALWEPEVAQEKNARSGIDK